MIFDKTNSFLHKQQVSVDCAYSKMFDYMNKELGYQKFATVEEVEEQKTLGVGSIGLFIQVLSYLSFVIPFLHRPEPTTGIITIMLGSAFLFIFLLVLGYLISWKYEKKHFFARSGIVFFIEFSIPILTAVVIVLILTQVVSDVSVNNLLNRL